MPDEPVNDNPYSDLAIIHGGPLFNFLNKIGMGHAAGRTGHLCALFVLATWVPIAILAATQNLLLNSSIKIPFLYDVSEFSRFVMVGPLLIAAEHMIEPWLRNVIVQFKPLIPEDQIATFKKHLDSAARWREMIFVELFLLAFAISRPHLDPSIAMLHDVSSWQFINGVPSYAETYALYVARPIMGWLLLRWLWKYTIWTLLICRIASLRLRLIPTHPDDTAGLGFVAVGQAKFAVLAFAFSLMVVGVGADQILFEGGNFMGQRWVIVLVVVLLLIIFATPLLAFTPKLIECKRNGLLAYGRLAQEYVDKFDRKWIMQRDRVDEEILGHGDIQTLADLENSYAIVQRMKIFIVDRNFLTFFILASALPFAPLWLTMYPIDQLVDRFLKNYL